MDQCAKEAQTAFPDHTAEANAKRDAKLEGMSGGEEPAPPAIGDAFPRHGKKSGRGVKQFITGFEVKALLTSRPFEVGVAVMEHGVQPSQLRSDFPGAAVSRANRPCPSFFGTR